MSFWESFVYFVATVFSYWWGYRDGKQKGFKDGISKFVNSDKLEKNNDCNLP